MTMKLRLHHNSAKNVVPQKVGIGICNQGSVRSSTMLSLLGIIFETRNTLFHVIERQGCYIEENRTWIVREAQRANCSHLLFLDSDIVCPPDTLTRMLASKKLIVGANYNERRLPLSSTVKFSDGNGQLIAMPVERIPHTLFSCAAVATGCLLTKMSVFEHVPSPWFKCEYNDDGTLRTGEDVFFCAHAKEAGFEVWCDPTLVVRHVGDYAF